MIILYWFVEAFLLKYKAVFFFLGVRLMEINDSRLLDSFLEAMSSDADWTVLDDVVERFLTCLETGALRCAVPDGQGWKIEPRVKQLILNVFRLGHLEERKENCFQFCDKHNLWPNMTLLPERGVRIVPGGTTIRRGAYVANGVTVMPPAYINIGAWVDEGSMIDSHALVGSCAQVGRRCHVSAAAQLGGVIEPVGQLPVIIEDDVFVGGNTGIYEGTHVGRQAVIGSGTILTRSTPVFHPSRGGGSSYSRMCRGRAGFTRSQVGIRLGKRSFALCPCHCEVP